MNKNFPNKPNEDKKNSGCCKEDHDHKGGQGKHSGSADKCSTESGKDDCSDSKQPKTPFKQEKDQHKGGGCCSGDHSKGHKH